MVLIVILVAVLLMVPLVTRATQPRPRSGGLRWHGLDWERVKQDDEEDAQHESPEPPP